MDFEQEIEEMGRRKAELISLKAQVSDGKMELTNAVLVASLESIEEVFSSFVKICSETTYYDKDLGGSLQKTVSALVQEISKLKPPTVTVSPQINIDLQPLSDKLAKQGEAMLGILNKMSFGDNDKREELYKLVTMLINRQIEFLSTVFKSPDYTEQLRRIAETRGGGNLVEDLKVYYGDNNRIDHVVPIYKTAK